MDESVGYKHPDGTPCKAKKQENCPFYKKDMQESVEIDDLKTPSEVSKVEKVATSGEMETIKRGGNPNEEKFEAVNPDDLTTMKPGSTNSKYRNMRNRLVEWVKNNNTGDGTYPLVDVGDAKATERLEPVFYDDGYMVSFQTTNGEGFNKERRDLTMSDEDYDALVDDMIAELDAKPHVGVFGGIPEISFKVASKDMAERVAKKFNQVSYWDNAQGAAAAKAEEEGSMSATKIKRLWARASKANKDYNWKTNQVTKTK
jgi:hypothetical protein